MAEVRWTALAADDLEAITEFIAADSPHYARLFAIDAITAVERLARLPFSGRIVPELGDQAIREILLGSYRILYRVKDDLVEILTVYHGVRLLDSSQFK